MFYSCPWWRSARIVDCLLIVLASPYVLSLCVCMNLAPLPVWFFQTYVCGIYCDTVSLNMAPMISCAGGIFLAVLIAIFSAYIGLKDIKLGDVWDLYTCYAVWQSYLFFTGCPVIITGLYKTYMCSSWWFRPSIPVWHQGIFICGLG